MDSSNAGPVSFVFIHFFLQEVVKKLSFRLVVSLLQAEYTSDSLDGIFDMDSFDELVSFFLFLLSFFFLK